VEPVTRLPAGTVHAAIAPLAMKALEPKVTRVVGDGELPAHTSKSYLRVPPSGSVVAPVSVGVVVLEYLGLGQLPAQGEIDRPVGEPGSAAVGDGPHMGGDLGGRGRPFGISNNLDNWRRLNEKPSRHPKKSCRAPDYQWKERFLPVIALSLLRKR
jgi:hypothetical protein